MQDGSSFWYAEGAPDSTIIYKVDPEANTRVVLIDPERLRRGLTPLLGHDPPGRGLPFERFEFQDDEKAVKFALEGKDFVLRLDTYGIRESPAAVSHALPQRIPNPWFRDFPASREMPSPDGRWILGFKDDNLLLRSTPNGSTITLTSDGVEDYSWIPGSWAWSPDGGKVVGEKEDWRGVPKIPIGPCFVEGVDVVRWEYHPTAGVPGGKKEFFVLDIADGRRVPIDIGNETEWQYIGVLGWQTDGSRVFLRRTHRYAAKTELLAADPATGRTQIIFEEDREVRPRPRFTLLTDGGFIRLSPPPLSERRAIEQLYLHGADGELIRVLTPDTVRAVSVIAVYGDTGWVYWRGRTLDPRGDGHLYRVGMDGTGLARLTGQDGQHDVQISPSRRFFVDTHQSAARPPSSELRSVEGALLQTLSTADISDLEALGWTPPEEFVVKAADGTTDIFGGIYKPPDFDPGKRYPVIQIIYAAADEGPRYFSWGWALNRQHQALSQLGFITVRNDWRGSFSWGTPQQPIYGNVGRYEVPDYMAVLEQLVAERPYMDLNRVGIFGASYGGYMALRAMLQAPDFYTVGIAISPIADMAKHFGNDGLIGPLETNREAYEYASNIRLAGNLRGKLLLIHGTCDFLVLHTMEMIEALAQAGKPYDLLLLPVEGHNMDGSTQGYWLDAVRRYFEEHLKP